MVGERSSILSVYGKKKHSEVASGVRGNSGPDFGEFTLLLLPGAMTNGDNYNSLRES